MRRLRGKPEEDGNVTGEEEEDELAVAAPLYSLDRRRQELDDEIARLEEQQLKEKDWTMKGEVMSSQRPLNSVLEQNMDLPMSHAALESAVHGAQDLHEEGDDLDDSKAPFDLELMLRRRIAERLFDDVERKTELPPSMQEVKPGSEGLDFEKSRVGLGDIYARQYEVEVLGAEKNPKLGEQKEGVQKLFAKLMYKLDSLTNSSFTPRPPMVTARGHLNDTPALRVEEAVPITMSTAAAQAPEEAAKPMKHAVEKDELEQDERHALRRANKRRRVAHVRSNLDNRGQLSIKRLEDRSDKLSTKNKVAKTGKVVQERAPKTSELMQMAGAAAAADRKRKR